MIDSSPMYGRAEAVTGDLLAEQAARPSTFLATKVWTTGRERGLEQMRHSAQLLRSEVIDLMQIHNLVDWRTHLASLRRMKERAGSAISGSPITRPERLKELARILAGEPGIDFVQLGYSLAHTRAGGRAAAGGRGARRRRSSPTSRSSAAICSAGSAGARFPEWASEFGCESLGAVVPQIRSRRARRHLRDPGHRHPDHMKDNLAAGFGRLPDARQRQQIRNLLWKRSSACEGLYATRAP